MVFSAHISLIFWESVGRMKSLRILLCGGDGPALKKKARVLAEEGMTVEISTQVIDILCFSKQEWDFLMIDLDGLSSFLRSLLPADCTWFAFGISLYQFPMVAQAVLLGGHPRVGLEDNLYLARGKLAPSNAALVDKAAKIIEVLGDEVATPADARQILGLNGRNYRYVTGEGIDGLLIIGRDDVQLSIAEYRPVAVYGAVPNPGEFPFRAGMTVRAALARSGSVRPVADDGSGAVSLRAAQLEGDVRALTIERDHAISVGWRLRRELQLLRADGSEPPQLPDAIANRWQDQQVALLEKQTSATSDQVDHLNRAIRQLTGR